MASAGIVVELASGDARAGAEGPAFPGLVIGIETDALEAERFVLLGIEDAAHLVLDTEADIGSAVGFGGESGGGVEVGLGAESLDAEAGVVEIPGEFGGAEGGVAEADTGDGLSGSVKGESAEVIDGPGRDGGIFVAEVVGDAFMGVFESDIAGSLIAVEASAFDSDEAIGDVLDAAADGESAAGVVDADASGGAFERVDVAFQRAGGLGVRDGPAAIEGDAVVDAHDLAITFGEGCRFGEIDDFDDAGCGDEPVDIEDGFVEGVEVVVDVFNLENSIDADPRGECGGVHRLELEEVGGGGGAKTLELLEAGA